MTGGVGSDRVDSRVLLILRTPPPFGGGEVIGAQLERLFSGRFGLLCFRRPEHDKAAQGRVSLSNLGFAVRYVLTSLVRIVRSRPEVLYIDIPKDRLAFLRTSCILICARMLRIRVVGDLAGADFSFLDSDPLTRRIGLGLLRRVFAVRVLGEQIAHTLARRGLENVVILPNGIEDPPGAATHRSTSTDTVDLLYVGKLAEAKGIDCVVAAAEILRGGGDRYRVNMVGEWEGEATRARILESVAERGLGDVVVFHGLLVGKAKWDVFRSSHLLVHPSRWDGQPVTILEALAFGLPVVATCVGAIPDTLRDGVDGRLMRDFSPGELAAGIEDIARTKAGYETYSRNARRSYEDRFSAAVFETGFASLMISALGSRS